MIIILKHQKIYANIVKICKKTCLIDSKSFEFKLKVTGNTNIERKKDVKKHFHQKIYAIFGELLKCC